MYEAPPPSLVDILFLEILTKADLCQISCRCCRKRLLARDHAV